MFELSILPFKISIDSFALLYVVFRPANSTSVDSTLACRFLISICRRSSSEVFSSTFSVRAANLLLYSSISDSFKSNSLAIIFFSSAIFSILACRFLFSLLEDSIRTFIFSKYSFFFSNWDSRLAFSAVFSRFCWRSKFNSSIAA